MLVILPVIPDPPSVVMQGEQLGIGSDVRHELYNTSWPAGLIGTAAMPELPVPRLTNLRPENYGTPSKIGPKVFSGGELVMLDYGERPVKVFVDPTQAWLMSTVVVDRGGQLIGLGASLLAQQAPVELKQVDPVAGWQSFAEMTRTQISPEIARSGLAKQVTAANVPALYGWQFNDMFVEMPAGYYISGVTRTGAGAVLGSCSVYAVEFGKLAFNPDPNANSFVGSVVSDASSGAYSIQVKPGIGYWAMAYKADLPEVAGLTAHSITAGSYDIYLRDPTTASAGGSAVFRPIGSPVVRGIQL
jgi:hypothetical protein